MRNMKLLVSHMIRLFLVTSFLTCAASVQGQVTTVIASEGRKEIKINIPAGKVMEIVGYSNGDGRSENSQLYLESNSLNNGYRASILNLRQTLDHPTEVSVKYIAGPQVLVMKAGTMGWPILSYKMTDNAAPTKSKPASPKADDIKLTDEFLMLDYTVQANTTYKLGISKDLKSWKPLFEFTPESDKLNVELPKIILGNKSFLKLE